MGTSSLESISTGFPQPFRLSSLKSLPIYCKFGHAARLTCLFCRGKPPKLRWSDYLSRKGWAERRRRILDGARSMYAIATIRRRLKLKVADFKEAAIELYYRVNVSLYRSDNTALRQVRVCQPTVFAHSGTTSPLLKANSVAQCCQGLHRTFKSKSRVI